MQDLNRYPIWGKPKVDNDIKLFLNFGGDLGGGTEIYGYANNNSKRWMVGFTATPNPMAFIPMVKTSNCRYDRRWQW